MATNSVLWRIPLAGTSRGTPWELRRLLDRSLDGAAEKVIREEIEPLLVRQGGVRKASGSDRTPVVRTVLRTPESGVLRAVLKTPESGRPVGRRDGGAAP